MTDTFKWAIFSPGRIARQFADAACHLDGCTITAVASSSLARAQAFADNYAVPHVFNSYQHLLEQVEIDAVYIASVHSMHHEQIRLCLNAGIPVLCEKPITVNATELKQLITIASQKKLFLMEALWTRFLPVTNQVKSWLDMGAIGNLQHIQASFGFESNALATDRLKNPNLAGGVLLDLGIYPIAMSQYFNPYSVKEVTAKAILGETGVDEQLTVRLGYDNGVISEFICSMNNNYENNLKLVGDAGSIEINAPFWGATAAKLVQTNATKTFDNPHIVNGFEYQILAAIDAINNKQLEALQMPLGDSLNNMRLMDTIRAQIGVLYPFESDSITDT
ncbi:MAG: Gfo/Idh/MocA family oxidoreductase [Gammaproteobacteria bacterium]|nr:Gfo/Idh/MocA family oxidoreductase [Gammaproteobacteria bacterium]NNJ71858.1 Gfo/Idh/MocA family oxidoreductase [Enterobacterales bacterium]